MPNTYNLKFDFSNIMLALRYYIIYLYIKIKAAFQRKHQKKHQASIITLNKYQVVSQIWINLSVYFLLGKKKKTLRKFVLTNGPMAFQCQGLISLIGQCQRDFASRFVGSKSYVKKKQYLVCVCVFHKFLPLQLRKSQAFKQEVSTFVTLSNPYHFSQSWSPDTLVRRGFHSLHS